MILFITTGGRGGGEGRYHCATCGEHVGDATDLVQIMGRFARATYHNPEGIACEILTLAACRSFRPSSYSTSEHTWFAGYAWRPFGCGGCDLHLGWRFEAAARDTRPRTFFALLTQRLRIDRAQS